MSINDRIREARKLRGLTQEQLGALINVAKTTIAGYEKNREPSAAKIGELADALHIDVSFLLQDEVKTFYDNRATVDEMELLVKKYRVLDQYGKNTVNAVLDCEYDRCTQQNEEEVLEPSKVIHISHSELKASAGFGWELDMERMEKWTVLLNDTTRKADFCVDVSGDSMEPKFHDGDIILVRSQPAVELGEIGLYVFDGCGYVKRQGAGKIESINTQYPDIEPTESNDIECKGLILGILDPEWIVER